MGLVGPVQLGQGTLGGPQSCGIADDDCGGGSEGLAISGGLEAGLGEGSDIGVAGFVLHRR